VSREATTKLAISAFACLNLIAVLLAHRPPAMIQFVDGWIERNLSPMSALRLDAASWLVDRYSYIVGLDTRWEMFRTRPLSRWRYRFTAQRADGSSAPLPIPLQSERTFLQANYFDFRETKIWENMATDPEALVSYVRYLCHAFTGDGGAEIQSITVELYSQDVRERSETEKTGLPFAGAETFEILGQMPCD
jgi:hypothetical protein